MGVVFQCVFFISMGAMLKVAPQIDTRGIFYKEQDANFYPTWTYVLARSLAGLPTSIQDALVYGSFIYWFAGFAPSAGCYFMFLLLTLLCAFTWYVTRPPVQVVFNILFSPHEKHTCSPSNFANCLQSCKLQIHVSNLVGLCSVSFLQLLKIGQAHKLR